MEIKIIQFDAINFKIDAPQINGESWLLMRESYGTYARIANIDENEDYVEYVYEKYVDRDKRKLINDMSDEDLVESVYNQIQNSGNVAIEKTYEIEVAFDTEDGKGFVVWLNDQGHDAKIGSTTGNYIDGEWTSESIAKSDILKALWDEYCDS